MADERLFVGCSRCRRMVVLASRFGSDVTARAEPGMLSDWMTAHWVGMCASAPVDGAPLGERFVLLGDNTGPEWTLVRLADMEDPGG